MSQLSEGQFLGEIATHQMHILHEDGVYRHIRFQRPGTGCMHFDLITYPGFLVYSGDMGCYVFSRLNDMFEFFRTDREYALRSGRKLGINLSYWAEKLQAVDGNRSHIEGVKKFSEELFNREVIGELVAWMRDHRHETGKDERRALWEEAISEVIYADCNSSGQRRQSAAHEFTYQVNAKCLFQFENFYEHDFTDYTYRFVWCCYAIAWGIQQYDQAKASAEKVAA